MPVCPSMLWAVVLRCKAHFTRHPYRVQEATVEQLRQFLAERVQSGEVKRLAAARVAVWEFVKK